MVRGGGRASAAGHRPAVRGRGLPRGATLLTGPIDAATHRRLLRHEAQVHAVPGRVLRDLGDALLLHDPADREPFWNRVEAIRWPVEVDAFDRRLAQVLVQFAALGRQPHAWLSPSFDSPPDLERRLVANGFEDMGRGVLMVARGAAAATSALADRTPDPAVQLERASGRQGDDARETAEAIVGVLLAAFAVGPERRESLAAETVASLGDERFTQYVVRVDGTPAAVARRATFDGISYLSSIGTLPSARGRGLGRLVTATAVLDAVRAGSELIHLGVWDENQPARRLYEQLGFEASGGACPDMLLVG